MLPLLPVTVGCEWWEEFEVDVGRIGDLCCPSYRLQLVVSGGRSFWLTWDGSVICVAPPTGYSWL